MEQKDEIQIAYYRVSTQKQGVSGLGLDAQRATVLFFLRRKPDYEFIEIESGKKNNRIQLDEAMKICKKTGGRLVIAKLDRLSRNVHFLSGLMEGRVNFICCDNPNATPMILHILAAVAEDESRRISIRTKDALKAKRERGFRLGNSKGITYSESIEAIRSGEISLEDYLKKRGEQKRIYNKEREIAIKEIKSMLEIEMNASQIARELNYLRAKTISGSGIWTTMQVTRLIKEIKDVKNASTEVSLQ